MPRSGTDLGGIAALVGVGAAIYFVHDWTKEEQPGGGEPAAGEDDGAQDPDPRPATLTRVQADSLADQLEEYFNFGWLLNDPWEDDQGIGAVLMVPLVTADVNVLLDSYGTRGSWLQSYNLSQAVANFLDENIKREVNAYYDEQGIKHHWA